jgi:hypothetical protein
MIQVVSDIGKYRTFLDDASFLKMRRLLMIVVFDKGLQLLRKSRLC